MRVLLVGAGASFSIKDVETGYHDALIEQGVDVKYYSLERRLDLVRRWLMKLWRMRGAHPEQRPSWPDVIYRASIEALEMALRFEVDWVLVISAMFLHPDALILMRRAGLRTSVLFTESPYDLEHECKVAAEVDACWTTERTSVPVLRQVNPNTRYIRHAYDPVRHRPIRLLKPIRRADGELSDRSHEHVTDEEFAVAQTPEHDVVFVGSGFKERIDTLSAVDWSGIDFGLYGSWDLLGPRHKLRKYLRGGIVNNDKATALYRQAKIGLNLYRTSRDYSRTPRHIEGAESMNPRAYELAACGVFQVSSFRLEERETFGAAVIGYQDPSEISKVIRLFLSNPEARSAFALSARQRIEPHTFAARAAQLLADLESFDQPIAKGA